MISVLPIQTISETVSPFGNIAESSEGSGLSGNFISTLLQSGAMSQDQLNSLQGLLLGNNGGNLAEMDGNILPLSGDLSIDEILNLDFEGILSSEELSSLPDLPVDQVLSELEDILDPEQFAALENVFGAISQIKEYAPEEYQKIVSFINDFHKNVTATNVIESNKLADSVIKDSIASNDTEGESLDGAKGEKLQKLVTGITVSNNAEKIKESFVQKVEEAVDLVQKSVSAKVAVPVASLENRFSVLEKLSTSNLGSTSDSVNNLDGVTAVREAASGLNIQAKTASSMNMELSVDKPVSTKEWQNSIGEKITWMAKNSVKSAKIQLTPAELGPIEVKLTVKDDAAMVSFTAAHATTREALEVSLPRLREMFHDAGMDLTDAGVDNGSSERAEDNSERRSGASEVANNEQFFDENETEEKITVTQMSTLNGLVDSYA